jgi:CRISPR/Cas system CMR subunit Cmr6 (Cas7 group RAMP superfamily)
MRFPVTLLDVLNEKRQSKGTMAEYIEQTMYSHSVTAVNDKVRFKNNFIKKCFTKSVEEIINHLKMLFSCKISSRVTGNLIVMVSFEDSLITHFLLSNPLLTSKTSSGNLCIKELHTSFPNMSSNFEKYSS